jgi:3-oxosteroid 1-dehydrogenase
MWIPNNRFMKNAGVEDSLEQAAAYLDAVVTDRDDAPGASRERRLAYIEQAPQMVDFLVSQGIKLRRIPSWPDYYDDRPGASVPGRTVVSQLFDANQLGEWKSKLRPGFIPLPVNLDEARDLPLMRRSWRAKKTLAKVIGRALLGKLTGKQWITAGAALQGQMLRAALKAGVEFRLNSAVSQLVIEEGRVSGVVTKKDGESSWIGARVGVLINAGGFSRNQRMLDEYTPGASAEWTNTASGDTGEVIEEAMRVGAAVAQMDECIGSQIALPPGNPAMKPMLQNDIAKPHAIVVDQTGVRYMRETGSYMDFCKSMRERDEEVPAIPSWMVIDSQYLNKYMLAGTMPGSKKPEAWYAQKFLRQGQTLEALASACDMDPGKLRESVERFNGFVRKGRDEDFQRGARVYEQWLGDPLHSPNKTLGTIEQAPFFAIQVYPGNVSTFGGLLTDVHARVVRADASVIPGLYATGTSTASVMGRMSPGAGSSIGPSFTWAYVAAKHAARET